MDDSEFEGWVVSQRAHVEDYLRAQGIRDPNVGPWPAFEIAPVFAIWAVESKKVGGKIGWWAFSGDCPPTTFWRTDSAIREVRFDDYSTSGEPMLHS